MGRDNTYDNYKKRKSSSLKGIRHFFEYLIIKGLIRLGNLFPVSFNQKLGRGVGRLGYRFAKKDRGIAEYQLKFCFPDKSDEERDIITKGVFENFGMTLFEALSIEQVRKNPDKWIKLHNVEAIEKAKQIGNGAVLLFAHVGNWELLSVVYDMLDIKGMAIGALIGNPKVDEIVFSRRKASGLRIIPRNDKSSGRSFLKAFKNNEFVMLGFDQDTRVKSVFADFFGRKASTPVGVANFGQKFDAPVLAAFGARMPDGTHHFFFDIVTEGPYEKTDEEAVEMTQTFNDVLEKHIRKYPDQWAWFHRRWKTQPDK